MEALTKIPASFAAGTTVKYTRTYADFPADQGWSLTLHLRGASVRDITATPTDASFSITIGAGAAPGTADITPGEYTWEERVTKAGEVFTPPGGAGTVRVLANTATAAAGALQSQAEKDLVIVEAKISGRLTADLEDYQIAGRAVRKIPIKELYKIRDRLRSEIRAARTKGKFTTPIRASMGRVY